MYVIPDMLHEYIEEKNLSLFVGRCVGARPRGAGAGGGCVSGVSQAKGHAVEAGSCTSGHTGQ